MNRDVLNRQHEFPGSLRHLPHPWHPSRGHRVHSLTAFLLSTGRRSLPGWKLTEKSGRRGECGRGRGGSEGPWLPKVMGWEVEKVSDLSCSVRLSDALLEGRAGLV